jgi:hypothetical protein
LLNVTKRIFKCIMKFQGFLRMPYLKIVFNKLAKSSKSLSPSQADGALWNFGPADTDFAKASNT